MSVDWPSKPGRGLVDQDPAVGQRRSACPALPPASSSEPIDIAMPTQIVWISRLDELHRVVDREPRVDRSARAVDVDRDVLVGVLGLEVQQLGDDQVGHRVVDRRAEEDDPLVEQAAEDVELALAAGGALDDHGHEGHALNPTGFRSWASARRFAAPVSRDEHRRPLEASRAQIRERLTSARSSGYVVTWVRTGTRGREFQELMRRRCG